MPFPFCLACSFFLLVDCNWNPVSPGEVSDSNDKAQLHWGRLITQLINPADVTVNARFFLIWIHIFEMGFGPWWKCLFFFFLIQTLRDSRFPGPPLCSGERSLVFQRALSRYCSHGWFLLPECVSHHLAPGSFSVLCVDLFLQEASSEYRLP